MTAVVLFGGHALSGLLGAVALLPFFAFSRRRILLSLGLLTAPAGLGHLALFDLFASGAYAVAAIPALLSAAFAAAFVALSVKQRRPCVRNAVFLTALLVPPAWGHAMTLAMAHPCFMGACA